MIKFWSYEREYNKIKNNLLKNLNKTIKSGNIFFGKQLEKFENRRKNEIVVVKDLKFIRCLMSCLKLFFWKI